MSAGLNLTSLILAVRRRANIESQSAFISDAELTEELNFAGQELTDLLMEAGGQPWNYKSVTFSTALSKSSYDLISIGASDLYRIISVDLNIGGYQMSARPYMEFERNKYRGLYQGFFGRTGWPMYYRLRANAITFIPLPDSAYQCTLNYYPAYIPLTNPTDVFDQLTAGWEEYMIWKVVAYCKQKGDEDPGYAVMQLASLKERIQAAAAKRDADNPERVHEVGADDDLWDEW